MLLHIASYCFVYCSIFLCIALYCSALLYVTLYCSVLRCTALYCCVALYCYVLLILFCCSICSILLCIAVCYSILLCVPLYCSVLLYVALYCCILLCIALHCSVLLCVTLYCSTLLYIALYCSVLLRKLCFSYSAFNHVQVINVGLESVSAAAASWPVTVLICAPACTHMATPFPYLFCKFIVIMHFLIQKYSAFRETARHNKTVLPTTQHDRQR